MFLAFGLFLKMIYRLQIRQEIYSDFWSHIWLHDIYLKEGQFVFPPLYYFSFWGLLKVMPFLLTNAQAAAIILILAFLAKFTITYFYLTKGVGKGHMTIALLSLSLLFFFPFYLFDYEGPYLYMGKFTPNVWHNCTLTFVWPFSFMLFWDSLKWFDQPKTAGLWRMGLWSLLILISKPSFLFAFIPVFLFIGWFRQPEWRQGIAIFVGVTLAGIWGLKEVIYSYSIDHILYGEDTKHQVVLLPLAVYKLYADTPFLEILASFVFPITAFALVGKALIADFSIQFALMIAASSLLIYLLLAELGPRFPDANFYWQIPIALSILYTCICKRLLEITLEKKAPNSPNWRLAIIFVVFLGNIASGIYYLHYYMDTKYYL